MGWCADLGVLGDAIQVHHEKVVAEAGPAVKTAPVLVLPALSPNRPKRVPTSSMGRVTLNHLDHPERDHA